MAELNVHLTFSSPYEPRTNPFAERMGGSLTAMTRTLLLEGSYPPKFWSVLVRIASWINN